MLRMKVSPIVFSAVLLIGFGSPVTAAQVGREQDIVDLRLGQRVLVDDGSCPAGQIKEVTGVTLTTTGIARARKCVPRVGTKK
jgi:Family of unknown function (DUF6719)